MEAREIASAEKKLTDASLPNFICLDIKQDTTGKWTFLLQTTISYFIVQTHTPALTKGSFAGRLYAAWVEASFPQI